MDSESMIVGRDLFRSLRPDEVSRLHRFVVEMRFGKGETIYNKDDPATRVFLNLEGIIYLKLPANPPEFSFVIHEVKQGELFGVSPLLGHRLYTSSASAVESARVMAIEAQPLQEILLDNPAARLQFLGQVADVYFSRYVGLAARLQAIVEQISFIEPADFKSGISTPGSGLQRPGSN